MTTIQIRLPDDVAAEAQAKGLLREDVLQALVREELLRRRNFAELLQMAERVSANNEPMTESEVHTFVQAEIKAYREEKRAADARRS